MKIFAIRNDEDAHAADLGYLLYYEADKKFYIELPNNTDLWETPLILDSFARRGEKTINSYWSLIWVQQRIVPPDRQNLGQILKDNGLREYDEYELLILAMGRCAQDSYYLAPVPANVTPEVLKERFSIRIDDFVALDDFSLLVFFRDGCVKKCCLKNVLSADRTFELILKDEQLFKTARLETGGHGVCWDVNIGISDARLYELGEDVPLGASDFAKFAASRVVTSAEAAEILGCTRQNIDDLVRRAKLHPIKTHGKTKLYLKSEVEKRTWE